MKLKLTAQEIRDKIFPGGEVGYDSLEVDTFLDIVMSDYVQIDQHISALLNTIKNLEIKQTKLIKDNNTLNMQLKVQETVGRSNNTKVKPESNSNYLDRLKRVEDVVLNK